MMVSCLSLSSKKILISAELVHMLGVTGAALTLKALGFLYHFLDERVL